MHQASSRLIGTDMVNLLFHKHTCYVSHGETVALHCPQLNFDLNGEQLTKLCDVVNSTVGACHPVLSLKHDHKTQ